MALKSQISSSRSLYVKKSLNIPSSFGNRIQISGENTYLNYVNPEASADRWLTPIKNGERP
jgi:hypothetical protein